MKKILFILSSLLLLSSCYEDYIMDYEYSGAYIAYQYDLRTFVYGEDNAVGFTVCLGGVQKNERDRSCVVSIDNSLLSCDLKAFDVTGECDSFTAIEGFLGQGGIGLVSNGYVTSEIQSSGISSFTALPDNYYTTSKIEGLKIKKGRHTAEVLLYPTEELFADAKTLAPYYALGLEIVNADVDSVLRDKSFQVMAIKVENKFFGNWYHGGRVQVRKNKTGELVSEDYKSIDYPQADAVVCVLTTTGINSSRTNKSLHSAGELDLIFNEDGTIDVSDHSGVLDIRSIPGQPSHYKDSKLIQNREIYLNYAFSNGNGNTTYVTDTLKFRNRIRDGFNEWQDENTENYK